MKRKLQFGMTLTLVDTETECVEVEVNVEANYWPGHAAVMYLRNGDPGHPEEPDEVEIIKVTRKDDGTELEWDFIPARCKEALEEAARESLAGADDDGPEPPDREPEDDTCRTEHFADTAADR